MWPEHHSDCTLSNFMDELDINGSCHQNVDHGVEEDMQMKKEVICLPSSADGREVSASWRWQLPSYDCPIGGSHEASDRLCRKGDVHLLTCYRRTLGMVIS